MKLKILTDTNGTKYKFENQKLNKYINEKKQQKINVQDTMNAIAESISQSPDTIKAWRQGRNGPADIEQVKALATFLGGDYHDYLVPIEAKIELNKSEYSNVIAKLESNTDMLMQIENSNADILNHLEAHNEDVINRINLALEQINNTLIMFINEKNEQKIVTAKNNKALLYAKIIIIELFGLFLLWQLCNALYSMPPHTVLAVTGCIGGIIFLLLTMIKTKHIITIIEQWISLLLGLISFGCLLIF